MKNEVGDLLRFRVMDDKYDGLKCRVIAIQSNGTVDVDILEGDLVGTDQKAWDVENFVHVSPLELLAEVADE